MKIPIILSIISMLLLSLVLVSAHTPYLTFSAPKDGSSTTASYVSVNGTAMDSSGIKKIIIERKGSTPSVLVFSKYPTSLFSYYLEKLKIEKGWNTIRVSAYDKSDFKAVKEVKVFRK